MGADPQTNPTLASSRFASFHAIFALLALAACSNPPPVATLDWSRPPSPTPAPPNPLPRLATRGAELVREDGTPVRLRGLNVCSFEFDATGATWRLDGDRSALLATLADPARWNANVVRVPVNQEWFLTDPAYVQRLELLIDDANRLGVYVILDVQWEVGRRQEPYSDNILGLPTFGDGNTTEAFWLAATDRWVNRTNLLYDLINEPHDAGPEETAEAMQALVDAIRRRVSDAVIVIGGMDWAHTIDWYRVHPLAGANLLYSAHQYLPYDEPEGFAERFGNAAARLPVIVGEFLADPSEATYATQLVDFAGAHGVDGWLPWAIGCGIEPDDDLGDEPFATLARRMRD